MVTAKQFVFAAVEYFSADAACIGLNNILIT